MKLITNSDLYYSYFIQIKDEYELNYFDYYFSRFLLEKEDENRYLAHFIFMCLGMHTRKGNVCLDLRKDFNIINFLDKNGFDYKDLYSELSELNCIGKKLSDKKPLVMKNELLYFYRFFHYETFFAQWIKEKSCFKEPDLEIIEKLKIVFLKYFNFSEGETDWQKFAVLSSCLFGFCAISGGPGTGKTTTIAKIISVIAELFYLENPVIKICAPTGKAASRLIEALKKTISELGEKNKAYYNIIPEKAYTIHKLLGYNFKTSDFKYNKDNRLRADFLIVDEASMIDLRLMSCLASALEDDCRLILSGDRFQLASVSPGSVFGDICRRGEKIFYSEPYSKIIENFFDINLLKDRISPDKSDFSDCIIELEKNYRFKDDSGIKKLADTVKAGNEKDFENILNSDLTDIFYINMEKFDNPENILKNFVNKYYSPLLQSENFDDAMKKFSEFMILTPVNDGVWGVNSINNVIEKILTGYNSFNSESEWYNGKPVMISGNDYKNSLFNGDIGIFIGKNNLENGSVFFSGDKKLIKQISPLRLENFETVYSMTVHKSQGSEFDNIFIIIPDYSLRVLSRELLYTAVTRAKKKVFICGSKSALKFAINHYSQRTSGLFTRLWE